MKQFSDRPSSKTPKILIRFNTFKAEDSFMNSSLMSDGNKGRL